METNISLRGRLTIAKTMLISQMTYIRTVLTPNSKRLEEIQQHINNYVMNITLTSKNWINSESLYTDTTKGGMRMNYGPEKFNHIIKAAIPVISSMFASYKLFKNQFPSTIKNSDNTWVTQNIFYNMKFCEQNNLHT